MHKKGLALSTIIAAVLILLFLAGAIVMIIRPLANPMFHLGLQDQVCRWSIILSEATDLYIFKPIKPICSTGVVSFTKDFLKKQAKGDETFKDTGIRVILDGMQRCKDMVSGERKDNILGTSTDCYICYSLHTDKTFDVSITEEDLLAYSLTRKAANKKSYYYNLNSDAHLLIFSLDGGLRPNREYGIMYQAPREGATSGWLVGIGAAVGCIASVKLTALTLGAAAPAAIWICGGGAIVFGGAPITYNALANTFHAKNYKGLVQIGDFPTLEQQGCSTYVS